MRGAQRACTRRRTACLLPLLMLVAGGACVLYATLQGPEPATAAQTSPTAPAEAPPAAAPQSAAPSPSSPPTASTSAPAGQRYFVPRTVPLSDPEVHYEDAFDTATPRPGEQFVRFAEYLDCLAERLRVDRAGRVELPFLPTHANVTIPYLLVMATSELRDIKTLMCNINVPIRHLMYVQNGPVPAVTALFDDVQRAFSFTSRLKILRYVDNVGFAGAVNAGIRDALRYPFREVPFFQLSNNDVRFHAALLPHMVAKFYDVTRNDEAMIRQLEAEVATEPNQYTPPHRRSPLLRANGNDTYLVTSRLLPDRIRYMAARELKRAFAQFGGGLFFQREGDTSSWGQSRLALETVGLWDENLYPAYYEDTDWRWRQFALGFQDVVPPVGMKPVLHYGQVTLKTAQAINGGQDVTGSEYVRKQKAFALAVERIISGHMPAKYQQWKWRTLFTQTATVPYLLQDRSRGALPVDTWVWDVRRRECIAEATALATEMFYTPRAQWTSAQKEAFTRVKRAETIAAHCAVNSELSRRKSYVSGGALKRLPHPVQGA